MSHVHSQSCCMCMFRIQLSPLASFTNQRTLLVLVNLSPLCSHNWLQKNFISAEITLLLTNNVNIGLKIQNGKKLSLDLIFIDNFCQNIRIFCKENSMLQIHSKPTEFTQKRTEIDKNFQCVVCSACEHAEAGT